ncbi:MAG: galactokinase [Granulosicoccus sp.]|nr:galactokinase [Granulosicoccus sp.]
MSPIGEESPERLLERFNQKFARSGQAISAFFAPGRVNLIGEYTDFTGGLVFPCAINQGTRLLIRPTHDHQYRFASTNFDLMAQLEHSEISQTYGDNWINYPLGVLDQFIRRGVQLDGFDCLYSGNVPNGAGLSSSASIEVVTAFALDQLLHTELPLLELVHIAQAAENDFVGMQCGIMDQFAVAFARSGNAMMLDCHTLEHRQVPLHLDGLAIVVSNTNQRRELNESAYNDRVHECSRALDLLAPVLGITHLGQLSPRQLDEQATQFAGDSVALMRARHIADENARVRAAVPALENGDMQAFGSLMNASHDSLRDLFEVSSGPLDHLVRLARMQPGVLGSRLTGAGFGGCTVSLMPESGVSGFIRQVGADYTAATGLTADFYTIQPGDGVRRLGLDTPT